MQFTRIFTVVCLAIFLLWGQAEATDEKKQSYHGGFFHPNGLDVFGYSVEKKLENGLYRYYTFGIPSGASIGYSYYSDFNGNGLTATMGVGVGVLFTSSVAYQFNLQGESYFKIGAGYTANVGYEGAFPVLSYEQRF